MPTISESELSSRIKQGVLGGFYLLYGDEPVLAESYVKKICACFGGEAIEKMGQKAAFEDIYEAARTVSFFGAKCILVSDFPLDSLSEEDAGLLCEMAGAENTVVFYYPSGGLDYKAAKVKKALAAAAKYGSIVEFKKLDSLKMSGLLQAVAQRHKVKLDAATARYLCEYCGDDLQILKNELLKLIVYVGEGGCITDKDIEAVSVPCVSVNVFNLVRAALYHKGDEVFGIIDGLFYERARAVTILAAVSSAYVGMLRAVLGRQSGRPLDAIAADFGYRGNAFQLRKSDELCRRLSHENLRRSIVLIAECDRKLKSNTTDERRDIERLMCELMRLAS